MIESRLSCIRCRFGMTMVETLGVLAVFAIFLGIIVPALLSVQASARIAKTKAQFQQYVAALEAYRMEYGYYPPINHTSVKTEIVLNTPKSASAFIMALSGRRVDGDELTPQERGEYNPRAVVFYQFSEEELWRDAAGGVCGICDACGNPNIHLMFDYDGDGWITEGVPVDLDSQQRQAISKRIIFYTRAREHAGAHDILSYEASG